MQRVHRFLPALVLALGCARSGPPPVNVDPDTLPLTAEEIDGEEVAVARAAWVRGVYLREHGDVPGALEAYSEAVRLVPRHAEFRLAYAELLVEIGRLREASSFLQGAIEHFGGMGAEHLLLARLTALEGDLPAALGRVDSALVRDPNLAPAWELRGRLLLDADRASEAQESFERADSLAPDEVATLEGLADAARRSGDLEGARRALERVLAIDPERLAARRALAALYRAEGRNEAAKDLVLRGLDLDPEDPERLEAAIETFLRTGDLEEAADLLGSYHEAGQLDPRLGYLYGRVLLQLDRLAAADSVLRPLADVEELHGVETLLGDIAARNDSTARALEHYRRAIEADPDDCIPQVSLALLLVRSTAADSAGEARALADSELARAERITDPESYRCNLLLGLASMNRRNFAAAARHLEAALRLDPENRDVLFNLAMAAAESGDSETALAHGRALLDLEPEDAAALNLVGYILAERGEELAESEALIRKALSQDPDNGYYVDSLGWVLYQKGEFPAAVAALERAVELTEEKDALILEHLGDAYSKAGRLPEAQRTYLRAQTLDPDRTSLGTKLADLESKLGKP